MDLSSIAAGATVASGAQAVLNIVKGITTYLKERKESDPKLLEMFDEARKKIIELYESDIKLRKMVLELQEKLEVRDSITFDEKIGACFKQKPDGAKDGPYCSTCYGNNDKFIRLDIRKDNSEEFYWCNVCDQYRGDKV